METIRIWLAFAADVSAVVLMVGLIQKTARLSLPSGIVGTPFKHLKYFAWAVIAMAVTDCVNVYADVIGKELPEGGVLAAVDGEQGWLWLHMAVNIVNVFMTNVILFMWLAFLCWYLYHDGNYIRHKFKKWSLPLLFSMVIAVCAFILIVYTGKAFLFFWICYAIYILIRAYYFINSLWMIHIYKAQNGVLRFLNIRMFFLPMLAGWFIEEFTSIPIRALGSAAGVIFLYLSMDEELKYRDRETGLYNTDYIHYLKKLARQGKRDFCSALLFNVKDADAAAALAGLLEEMLPEDCEGIRCSDFKIAVPTQAKEQGALSMMIEDIKAGIDVEAATVFRDKDENVETFLDRVFEWK